MSSLFQLIPRKETKILILIMTPVLCKMQTLKQWTVGADRDLSKSEQNELSKLCDELKFIRTPKPR